MSVAVPSTGSWHFVACRINSQAKLASIKLDNEPWQNVTMTAGARGYNATPLVIGDHPDAISGGNYFNGKIDSVQIFDRVLSNLEIAQIYNNGAGLE